MMNSKYTQIDRFLKIWRDIALENPNLDFTDDSVNNMIYGYLIRFNIKTEDKYINVDDYYFQNWVENFRNVDNIDCFVSPSWKCFCQFKNIQSGYNEYLKGNYSDYANQKQE